MELQESRSRRKPKCARLVQVGPRNTRRRIEFAELHARECGTEFYISDARSLHFASNLVSTRQVPHRIRRRCSEGRKDGERGMRVCERKGITEVKVAKSCGFRRTGCLVPHFRLSRMFIWKSSDKVAGINYTRF